MRSKETVEFTNMCMVYDGDKVLVQDRMKGSWTGIAFPGGHVEQGEPFTDAVIREVYEETGLQIASPQLCGIKDRLNADGSRYVVLFYRTNQFSGELHSSKEGEVFWTDREKLPQMPLARDMDGMLKVFCEDSLSGFYYYQENGEWKYILK